MTKTRQRQGYLLFLQLFIVGYYNDEMAATALDGVYGRYPRSVYMLGLVPRPGIKGKWERVMAVCIFTFM